MRRLMNDDAMDDNFIFKLSRLLSFFIAFSNNNYNILSILLIIYLNLSAKLLKILLLLIFIVIKL